ncbi:MAG: histone deacetylase [Proteobacteria bacterium]|nr:histone deacetylase [Pseudomonadota bacterium]
MPFPSLELFDVGLNRLRRLQRRLRSSLNVIPYFPQAVVVYHEEYAGIEKYIADAGRASKILNYLRYEGCLDDSQIVTPRTATITQLSLVHDFSYLSQLYEPNIGERIFGQGLSDEALKTCIEQQRLMTGGTVRAARMSLSSLYPRRIINIGGGFHHAYSEGGYAFCVFNDVAIAVHHLRKHNYNGKILIIDLDLHQGDGTKKIFAHDPSVITYSVHAENWMTETCEGAYDVPLGPGIGDSAYLEAIRSTLPNIIHREQPDLVFYLAGVDVAEDDELGDWRVSHDAIFERDKFVDECVGKRRMVVVSAGGYGPNAWRHSARFYGYLLSHLEKPIASDNERLLRAVKKVSKALPLHDLTADETEDDLFGDLFGPMKRTRLFDFYSKLGVECALEKIGILEHLRKLGYPSPHIEFELDHPNGQAVRLFADDERKILLIECIIDEKKFVGDMRMLWIEWLLSQNPNAEPSPDRPLLPGQTYPGLGCLTKIIGLLFMICDRLKLDAIGFNPAHYHVCFLAKGQGCFEKPADEARFRVAQALTAGLNIQQASMMLGNGLCSAGNTFKWIPARMVIPISQAAHAYFQTKEYQSEVAALAAEELKKYGTYGQSKGYRRRITS